jgi:opacity protein-like surface antigen
MKRLLGITASFVLFSTAAMAASWTGTVVDTMCKGKDVASHTRQCALGCAKSGFGLVTSDGKFVKFDEAGNAKALAALKASKKDKDLRATVTGTMNDDVIAVDSIHLED